MLRSFILASLDFKLVYKVQNAVRDLYQIIHISPKEILKTPKLVVSSQNDGELTIQLTQTLKIHNHFSIEKIRSLLIEKMRTSDQKVCIIGIDPGKATGASIVFCGNVFSTTVVYSFGTLERWIKENLKEINFDQLIFKVGNGGGENKIRIIENLRLSFDSPIEEVNEKNTSIKEINELTIHEQAAIKIANREGTVI